MACVSGRMSNLINEIVYSLSGLLLKIMDYVWIVSSS